MAPYGRSVTEGMSVLTSASNYRALWAQALMIIGLTTVLTSAAFAAGKTPKFSVLGMSTPNILEPGEGSFTPICEELAPGTGHGDGEFVDIVNKYKGQSGPAKIVFNTAPEKDE